MADDNQELGTLKKANESEVISREEFEHRILEIARCKRDIAYFAENYFRIVSLNTGLGIIKLYDKQRQMLQHLVDNDRSVILSSRQTGKCVFKDSTVKVRNKRTNEICEMKIEDFFKMIANAKH